jgi:Putative Ig domain
MPHYFRFCFAGILSVALLVSLSACDDDSSRSMTSSGSATNGRSVPLITGAPPNSVTAGENYEFQPTVTAPAGATLSFTIANQPSWAKFDASTGALTGLPAGSDAGDFADIVIAVADGVGSADLAPFSIHVVPRDSAVATITWTAATPDAGSSTAQEPAGYRVYYGTSVAGMTHVVTVADPSETSFVLANLSAGTWFFAIASYAVDNAQSALSPTVSVTL